VIVGYLLARYRTASGLSQRALGAKAHVRQALISEIETGKKSTTLLSTAERLAEALGISLEKLLREEKPDPHTALYA
jgi:transcriptional regulator with XRE-family HTH domain